MNMLVFGNLQFTSLIIQYNMFIRRIAAKNAGQIQVVKPVHIYIGLQYIDRMIHTDKKKIPQCGLSHKIYNNDQPITQTALVI